MSQRRQRRPPDGSALHADAQKTQDERRSEAGHADDRDDADSFRREHPRRKIPHVKSMGVVVYARGVGVRVLAVEDDVAFGRLGQSMRS